MWFTEAHWRPSGVSTFFGLCATTAGGTADSAPEMAGLSAVVFALSWWLGLYLLARGPGKPVLVLAAVGLCTFGGSSLWTPCV